MHTHMHNCRAAQVWVSIKRKRLGSDGSCNGIRWHCKGKDRQGRGVKQDSNSKYWGGGTGGGGGGRGGGG